jgi:hypothetical protein
MAFEFVGEEICDGAIVSKESVKQELICHMSAAIIEVFKSERSKGNDTVSKRKQNR